MRMNHHIIKRILVLLLFICFYPQDVMSESLEETYASAIRQLNQEGFSGIDKALKVFEEIIQKDPNFIRAYLSAADAYLLKYEFTEKKDKQWLDTAMNYLDTAIGKDGKLTTAYFKRAVIHFNLEEPDKAITDLKKSMELSPAYFDARILYLQYLLSVKKKEEAGKFADSSIKLFPKDPAPLKYFGDVFFHAGAYQEAIEYYKKVIALVPNAPNTHFNLGRSYQNLKKYDKAVGSFKKALAQNSELIDAHFNLAYCLSEMGKFKEAITHLETYIKKTPKDVSALNNLAILYEQTGEVPKARLTWLKVKEATEDSSYKERADQHLYRLLSPKDKPKASLEEKPASPKTGGKKDDKKTE